MKKIKLLFHEKIKYMSWSKIYVARACKLHAAEVMRSDVYIYLACRSLEEERRVGKTLFRSSYRRRSPSNVSC